MYKIDRWQYQPSDAKLYSQDQQITLKPLLNKLLHHFVSYPNQLFSVEELKRQVWQQEYLTDSAVKKAISELRQQIRSIACSEREYIKNQPGQGYCFTGEIKELNLNSKKPYLLISGFAIGVVLLYLLWLHMVSSSGSEPEVATAMLPEQAETLYLQGKSLYYKGGDQKLVEKLFSDSIAISSTSNPAHGALLDLWGLQLRSVKLKQRPAELQHKVNNHINRLLSNPDYQSPDNIIALAKYYLVNVGDKKSALRVINESEWNLNSVYDPHIQAFTQAISGEVIESQRIMNNAERRFPDRNVILWYKAFVSLINNEIAQAQKESQWAQQLAPDWYPLVFIASHLPKEHSDSAWQHLQQFKPAYLNMSLSEFRTFRDFLDAINTVAINAEHHPFEIEILYLLGRYFRYPEIQKSCKSWIAAHYPEKQMMLTLIDNMVTNLQSPSRFSATITDQ